MARSNGDLIAKARADDRGRRARRGRADASTEARDAARALSGEGRAHERCRFEGMRVLDLSRLLPGGFCSLLLADFGADVVKVEDTGHGRLRPLVAAVLRGRRGDREVARCSSSLNRGKRSMRART